MVRSLIFVARSAGLVKLSCPSPSFWCHGFSRLFAFEFPADLIVVDILWRVRDPFSAQQILSWTLGLISIALAPEAFRLLRDTGRLSAAAGQSENVAFENARSPVTDSARPRCDRRCRGSGHCGRN
jgi:hypothetical protein